jgi:dihydroorotate dehydrogenase electron transfer subunit
VTQSPALREGPEAGGVAHGSISPTDNPKGADGRTLAPIHRRPTQLVLRRDYGPYAVLTVADPEGPRPDPGQFYMLTAATRWGGGTDERPFLPRAFSVMRAHEDQTLDFLLEDVGPGTNRLAELGPGDELLILGPLGKGFTPPRDGRRPVLVGGGVGIAPLAIWGDILYDPVTLLGFRDAHHAEGGALIPDARVITDDDGLVTDLLREELPGHVEVYACGPPPMLDAVTAICHEAGVPGQLAMESGMACGYGACFGCVVPTRNGYVRLCVDGPVIHTDEL